MAIDTNITYTTKEGIDYLIKFTSFPPNQLPIGIEIPVVDIVIETNANIETINNSATSLLQISQIISDYAMQHDAIYYCYCSDKPIKKSKNKIHLNHQQYRSLLFFTMFEKHNIANFLNRTVIIDDPERGNHYIHLMSRLKNEKIIDLISQTLNGFDK